MATLPVQGGTRYYPGQAGTPGPLARYLPPIPAGIVTGWLADRLAPGGWVLDPFCASPRLCLEAARAGYRVIVAANNPVAVFLLKAQANPPGKIQLSAALAELAATHKGSERLEPHIRSLYATECASCGRMISAEAFLWERAAPGPAARIYHCPHCGDSGEHPATQADAERAAAFTGSSLHRARALERVAPLDDPDRPFVEDALEVYPPRALYALFTLINRFDSLPSERQRPLAALLLSAFDQANTLWPHPGGRARPRQLTVPPHYRENNLWQALEEAVESWTLLSEEAGQVPVPVTTWPGFPPASGGICLFEGRLKDLSNELGLTRDPQLQIGAVLAALPRPNQAFWALSALWSGWLWGREAAAPFKSVLRRRRYDWGWHTTALQSAFSALAPRLVASTPLLGMITEAEAGFLSAAFLAACLAGLELVGAALRIEDGLAQLTWRPSSLLDKAGPSPKRLDILAQESARQAGKVFLTERGQPSPYLHLHTAALSALVLGMPAVSIPSGEAFAQIQEGLQAAFNYRNGFTRYGGSDHDLDTGLWWLREPVRLETLTSRATTLEQKQVDEMVVPLADRVEIEVVRYLQKNPGCRLDILDEALCSAFPGLMTPESGLIKACLESYGVPETPDGQTWQLQPQDAPRLRRADLAEMARLLHMLGQSLGFETSGEAPILWRETAEEKGPEREYAAPQAAYAFSVLASTVVGRVIFNRPAARHSILLLPGSRAGLLMYKLAYDPRLNAALEAGWRVVKFRHLRRLVEGGGLNRANLDEQLSLDSLANDDPQIPLF